MTPVVIGAFFVFALLGMPIAFAIGVAAVAGLLVSDMQLQTLAQRMVHSTNVFPLLAIPLFMLAGEIMIAGGVMVRLVQFANSVVGSVRGGLAHVTVVSGMLLGSVSGAAVASASALGSALVPSLRKSYGPQFSASVVGASANLGPIIPPSSAMIVYALMAGPSVSIGALFIAGIVPGIILAVAMMITCSIIAKVRNFPKTGEPFQLGVFLRELRRSFVIFMMPVVVVGGIIGGVFTPTEGAAIAVVYALLIGFFVTRELKVRDLPRLFFRAAVTSSVVGALIAFASVVTFLFTLDLLPFRLASAMRDFTSDPQMFLFLVMLMLIVVGMFIESNAAYIMLAPLFAPLAIAYGIDPLHFGFLFVLNLVIGMMTPPVGILLFVMCGISKISLISLIKQVWPFVLAQFSVLILCFFVPDIVLFLPRLLGY
ncbi:MAG: TRAP transporter large permease [Geminicoccaceae bacterium]|nr:MAG: TRAP transporter large permease [Geminicoccaceae bacterium]